MAEITIVGGFLIAGVGTFHPESEGLQDAEYAAGSGGSRFVFFDSQSGFRYLKQKGPYVYINELCKHMALLLLFMFGGIIGNADMTSLSQSISFQMIDIFYFCNIFADIGIFL